MTTGEPAVIEVLDAATGDFLFAKDPDAQTGAPARFGAA
jgi:hypothetical protein